MAPSSRMQLARHRLRIARYSIGALALTAFAAFGFAVRGAHPATHTQSTVTASSDDDQSEFSFEDGASNGPASISPAPQSSVPAIQSGGS